jgi:hypothetical protein
VDARRLRLTMQLLCIALLLFAQQAALAHAVWHAHQKIPHGQHEQASAQEPRGSLGREVSAICALDVVLGEVLGAVPCGGHAVQLRSDSHSVTASGRSVDAAFRFLAPLSRGPPSLR